MKILSGYLINDYFSYFIGILNNDITFYPFFPSIILHLNLLIMGCSIQTAGI